MTIAETRRVAPSEHLIPEKASATPRSTLPHRPEIDGMRAIAILPVLIFHFFPSYFRLGYLGVDLFFVISGFLIASIIAAELKQGKFGFAQFYMRRIRRILPALLVVCCITSIATLAILIAPDLLRFAQSLIATLGFVANLYFWQTGGYFALNDSLKPLLHIWSLGVEEQYYMIFPVMLYLVFRYVHSTTTRCLLVAACVVLSFAINFYLESIQGFNPAFFLLPSRVWEFGAGALAALIPIVRPKQLALQWLAALLIAVNFWFVFPHFPAATFMVVGAAILLWMQWNSESFLSKIFTAPPLRFIGVISFSLYLWHWPIVALTRYWSIGEPALQVMLSGIFATFVLSILSWKYIEVPFRKELLSKTVLKFVAAAYAILLAFAVGVFATDGFPARHPATVNSLARAVGSNFRCPLQSYRVYGVSKACSIGDSRQAADTILIGNSHALMYAPALDQALKATSHGGLIVPVNHCLPTPDLNLTVKCLTFARKNMDAVIMDASITTVFIGLTWYTDDLVRSDGAKVSDPDLSLRRVSLIKYVRTLEDSNKKVYLLGPIAIPGIEYASIESRRLVFGGKQDVKEYLLRTQFMTKFGSVIAGLKQELGDSFLQPHETLCDPEKCYYARDGIAYFADKTHLSLDGALATEHLFEAALKK